MAHAHIGVYAEPASVKYHADVDEIFIYCGDSHLCMKTYEAVTLRDDLSRAITEAAQQHAQTVEA